MNKSHILTEIIASLRAELHTCLQAARATAAAATDPDSKAENKYDTRSLEASYLARGQAQRVAELQEDLSAFEALGLRSFEPGDVISVGALVTLKSADHESYYFFGPAAGGTEILSEGCEVMVFTRSSPLGQRLAGRKVGDVVTLPMGQARVCAMC